MNSITKFIITYAKNLLWYLLVAAAITTFLSFVLVKHATALESINLLVNTHTYSFLFIRWTVIFMVFMLWPHVVATIGKKANATIEQIMQKKNERFRVLVWLVLFELLVCENIIFKLIHKL